MLVPGRAHALARARTAEYALAPPPGSVLHVLDKLAPVEFALATCLEGFVLREIADMHARCAAWVARAPAAPGEVKVACASSSSESGCCGHLLGMRSSLNRYLWRWCAAS